LEDNKKRDGVILGHFVAGGLLQIFGREPKEALGIVLGIEVLERSKYASRFPSLFREGGPFLSDVGATVAGYYLTKEFRK